MGPQKGYSNLLKTGAMQANLCAALMFFAHKKSLVLQQYSWAGREFKVITVLVARGPLQPRRSLKAASGKLPKARRNISLSYLPPHGTLSQLPFSSWGFSHLAVSALGNVWERRAAPPHIPPRWWQPSLWGISHRTTWGVCWVCSGRQRIFAAGSKHLGSKPEMTILMNDAGQMKKNRWSHEYSYWSLPDPSEISFHLSHLHSLNSFQVINTNLQKFSNYHSHCFMYPTSPALP